MNDDGGQKKEVRFKRLIVRTVVSVVCLLAGLASVTYNTIVIKCRGNVQLSDPTLKGHRVVIKIKQYFGPVELQQ
jgi:hypothetical protein